MSASEKAELDLTRISPEASRFAADLFARFPELRRHAAMERQPGDALWSFVVEVPAASGDANSPLVVWVEKDTLPSVGFGAWHTHEDLWYSNGGFAPRGLHPDGERAALLDLLAGIFADRFILCEDIGGSGPGTTALLDLREEDALLEELTDRHSPGRARLRSWSGKLDRVVALEDLEADERG